MTRIFEIGSGLWFVLHYDAKGNMVALEEHDWREGGHIRLPVGQTWEEYFVAEALDRVSGAEFKAIVEFEARKFLKSDERKITVS
jgi:hypothetical protein